MHHLAIAVRLSLNSRAFEAARHYRACPPLAPTATEETVALLELQDYAAMLLALPGRVLRQRIEGHMYSCSTAGSSFANVPAHAYAISSWVP